MAFTWRPSSSSSSSSWHLRLPRVQPPQSVDGIYLAAFFFFFFFFLASASSSGSASAAVSRWHLLGGLLLLLLLLLGICVLLRFCFSDFLNWGRLFNLGLLLDGNEQANDVLGLDHVVLIDLELTEDIVNLSLGHLVSPGLEGVL